MGWVPFLLPGFIGDEAAYAAIVERLRSVKALYRAASKERRKRNT